MSRIKPFLAFVALIALVACGDQAMEPEQTLTLPTSVNKIEIANPLQNKGEDAGFTVIVSPSGDLSGVTDANSIQQALNDAKANGDAVYLTDGDAATVDHYYVSRNIVVGGFWGTLKGEGMDKTIIEAVRRSASDGFAPADSPYWQDLMPDLPTVLQLDYSTGDVTIRDLTVQVGHPNPVDPYIQPWVSGTNPTTAISTFIEILGGNHNTTVENVRFNGAPGLPPGAALGKNVVLALHVHLGEAPGDAGIGDLTFNNVVAEDIGIYGFDVSRFEWSAIKIVNSSVTNVWDGLYLGFYHNCTVTVEDMTAKNVGWGVYAENIFDSEMKISNVDFGMLAGGQAGIFLNNIPSGLEVTGNAVTGSVNWAAVLMNVISDATIAGNTIEDVEVRQSGGAPIYLKNSHDNRISDNDFEAVSGGAAGIRLRGESSGNTLDHNHFVKSGLPGWTAVTPDGPGAILLDASTTGNAVFEMMFPPGKGIARCQMIWDMTDDPETPEYDGWNEIHNWRPCENLSDRVAGMAEPEFESGFHRWH